MTPLIDQGDHLARGPGGSVQLLELEHVSSGAFGRITRCEMQRNGRGPWLDVVAKRALGTPPQAAQALAVESEIPGGEHPGLKPPHVTPTSPPDRQNSIVYMLRIH